MFLYTPAAAGGDVVELSKHPAGGISEDERTTLREHYRGSGGPNPL